MSSTRNRTLMKLVSWVVVGIVLFIWMAVFERYGWRPSAGIVAAYFLGGFDFALSTIKDGR